MNCFKAITEINSKMGGWCTEEKALTLASLVIGIRPKISVEIGVFAGRSLIPIALAHKEVGGFCIGIDPWTATSATEGYTGENKEWWSKQSNLDWAMSETFSWIQKLNLQSVCQIKRCRSDECAVEKEIGLLHVDGQHSEVCIKDVIRYTPFMDYGSIVVMDDINWKNDGVGHVAKAVEWMKGQRWVKLYDLESGAVFQKR